MRFLFLHEPWKSFITLCVLGGNTRLTELQISIQAQFLLLHYLNSCWILLGVKKRIPNSLGMVLESNCKVLDPPQGNPRGCPSPPECSRPDISTQIYSKVTSTLVSLRGREIEALIGIAEEIVSLPAKCHPPECPTVALSPR